MMNKIKTTAFCFTAMFLMAALLTTTVVNTGRISTAFAQNQSMMSNPTAETMNNTATAMNQTGAQMANQTSANQTSASKMKLTTSDVQDIRKTLDDVRKDIAEGKATEALKAINDIDNKLLVAMSNNPPPMLEKSTGNSNNK